jgi:hypothetical protein
MAKLQTVHILFILSIHLYDEQFIRSLCLTSWIYPRNIPYMYPREIYPEISTAQSLQKKLVSESSFNREARFSKSLQSCTNNERNDIGFLIEFSALIVIVWHKIV